MASLKEIRSRIASVTSTKKITSAMKMVSAAKLHKAEEQALRFLPYKDRLTGVLAQYLGSMEGEANIPLAAEREVRKVIIVAIASNSGLCGTYNSNVFKLFSKTVDEYKRAGIQDIEVIAIGKKMGEYAARCGYTTSREYDKLTDKLSYGPAFQLARELSAKFLSGECDEVKVIYNHFKNAGVQIPTVERYLPLTPERTSGGMSRLYFIEPDPATFVAELVPMVVRIRMYSLLLDAVASEHGARTTAMQVASDNAEKMIGEITQLYNRARQEVITNELLDIVGGSEALRN